MINISLSYIHCDEETDEVGADEPYVLAVAVALTPSVAGVQAPVASDVVVYPFENMHTDGRPAFGRFESFWGIGGTPTILPNPEEAIFLVAMMENDNGDPQIARGLVDTAVTASLVTSLAVPRAGKVTALIHDVDTARRLPTGVPNFDDAIGAPQELRFSSNELQRAEAGEIVTKVMVFNGDGGRYTLNFEARNPNWVGPVVFGDAHLQPGGFITPVFQQSDSILAALTVDKHGTMNVVWTDLNTSTGWQGPIAFGGSHLQPGAFITPVWRQSDTVFSALTVDSNGVMNVVWADLNNPSGWQGPMAFGGAHLQPGGFITPLFQQSDSVFAALTVDRNGAMNVVWADLNNPSGWQGPVAFGGAHLHPGGFVTPLFRQSETIFAALTVDKLGVMNVVWADLNNPSGWQGPIAFGGAHLQPGAFVTPLFRQSDTIFVALTVDRNGTTNVVWLDLNNPNGWQGPVAFGDPHLQPGAFITPLFQQEETIFAALTIDRNGAVNVIWADLNNPNGWQGPVAFGDPHLRGGAFITPLFAQDQRVFTALTADRNGAMNAVWADLDNPNGWQGPVAFGDPHLRPGAFVTPVFRQKMVFAALTVDSKGALNVVSVNVP